jgi:broad specificity phosphatase PhoE
MGDATPSMTAPTVPRRVAWATAFVLALATLSPTLAQTPPAQPPPAPAQSPPAAPAAPAPSQADLDLVKALRAGGHAIVMRHASADPDKFDSDPRNFKNVRVQQPLTDGGQAAARAFGESLRVIGVPVGEVLTSRFNRAYQTAVLAGFKDAKPVTELTEGSLVTSPNEQRRRASALKQLAAAPLPAGMNRLLVTHRVNIMQAFGKEWFEVKEGEASIFRVDNGAYSLIARVQLGEWQRLVAAKR